MNDVAQIAQRLDELEKRFAVAEVERDEYRALYLATMERCRKLEIGLLASKSEHLPDDGSQLSLDVLSMVLGDRQRAELDAALAAAATEQEVKAHTRRPPTGAECAQSADQAIKLDAGAPEAGWGVDAGALRDRCMTIFLQTLDSKGGIEESRRKKPAPKKP